MCGRFVLSSDADRLADHYGLDTVPVFGSGYNIAPSAQVPVVRRHTGRELALCHWGFIPHWVKEPVLKPINGPRGNPCRQTLLPGRVQAAALPGAGQRVLRVARGAGREAAFFHSHGGGRTCFPLRASGRPGRGRMGCSRLASSSPQRPRRNWPTSMTGCRSLSRQMTTTNGWRPAVRTCSSPVQGRWRRIPSAAG